jgi:hypothetical protein
MAVTRCPRCRAEDIAADAHPTRVLSNGVEARVFVCRNCYRPTELEYRIACDAAGAPYHPLPIRDALRGLREFYLGRLKERTDPEISAALADVERRLAIGPVSDT